MDKEEAIKILRELHDKVLFSERTALETLHPELKESEDERIRKSLTILLQHFCKGYRVPGLDFPVSYKDMLTWLEKQGVQKSKKVSLWKHWKDGICGNGEGKPIYLIKDGNAYRISSVLGCECDYIELSDLDELILPEKQGEQKSIDKIQLGKKYKCIASPRYTTFMIGEIYKPEDKFLCSLMNFCYNCFELIEDGEQNKIEALRTEYEKGKADAIAQMREEWSEEDERAIGIIKTALEHPYDMEGKWDRKFALDWLKSLKERYTWKPSEEQMRALDSTAGIVGILTPTGVTLCSLYKDLEKLKGE